MEDEFMQAAIAEARAGLAEGGIPIGSVLVLDGKIVGRGHNRRVQQASPILHAEMDCFETPAVWRPLTTDGQPSTRPCRPATCAAGRCCSTGCRASSSVRIGPFGVLRTTCARVA